MSFGPSLGRCQQVILSNQPVNFHRPDIIKEDIDPFRLLVRFIAATPLAVTSVGDCKPALQEAEYNDHIRRSADVLRSLWDPNA